MLERPAEVTLQLAEQFKGRIPVPGFVHGLRRQELAKQQQFGSQLGYPPLEKVE
jgi:hypothetical protein